MQEKEIQSDRTRTVMRHHDSYLVRIVDILEVEGTTVRMEIDLYAGPRFMVFPGKLNGRGWN